VLKTGDTLDVYSLNPIFIGLLSMSKYVLYLENTNMPPKTQRSFSVPLNSSLATTLR